MVEEGQKVPDFSIQDDSGKKFSPGGRKGRALVLYFYPKDDTSGCTAEAKDFSCMSEAFAAAGADVVGVSPDSVESHAKFKRKYDLNLRLAADASKSVAEAFGVWVEKSMYGRKYMGVERSTFLIDPKGTVRRVWRKVKVPGHAEEVLEAIRASKF